MHPPKVFTMTFADIYQAYINKAERKGRTRSEVNEIIFWLTGHDQESLQQVLKDETDLETFYRQAPCMNPNKKLIKGVVCGHRVEEIEDETMRHIRYLDKLVDELARGKKIEKILRSE